MGLWDIGGDNGDCSRCIEVENSDFVFSPSAPSVSVVKKTLRPLPFQLTLKGILAILKRINRLKFYFGLVREIDVS